LPIAQGHGHCARQASTTLSGVNGGHMGVQVQVQQQAASQSGAVRVSLALAGGPRISASPARGCLALHCMLCYRHEHAVLALVDLITLRPCRRPQRTDDYIRVPLQLLVYEYDPWSLAWLIPVATREGRTEEHPRRIYITSRAKAFTGRAVTRPHAD
jgi:hypothetical protein